MNSSIIVFALVHDEQMQDSEHIGHIGISSLDTAASTRFPRSRSQLQGQKSQDQNSMAMHIYLSWVAYIGINSLTHWCPQNSHGQSHSSKVNSKVTGPNFYTHAHLMCSPQAHIGHIGINTLGTAACTRLPSSKS